MAAAVAIARQAGDLLLSYFESGDLNTTPKGFLDVVTEADTESERLIVRLLGDSFPDDAVVGEEGTSAEPGRDRVWYVDPLDGTFNFSRHLPFWCVSLGLVDARGPLLGIVFDPLRDEMFTAMRGEQARLNGGLIRPDETEDTMAATIQLTLNYDREIIERSLADLNAVARHVMRLRNMGALALELAYVACGRLDAVMQRGSHPWDYAAGVLIGTEAGAVVTDIDGGPFDLMTDDALVACTAQLHASLLAMVNPEAPPP